MAAWEYAELYWRSDTGGNGVWWMGPDGEVERLGEDGGIWYLNQVGVDGWEVGGVYERVRGSERILHHVLKRQLPDERD